MEEETNHLLAEGNFENSLSPLRAQVVVVKDTLNWRKERMCVDYSQTISLYTELDRRLSIAKNWRDDECTLNI